MDWTHSCSLEWMRERQRHLTASDVRELLPVTATGRKRKVDDSSFHRVMARKVVELTQEDCMSYGAAARGHMLEPYAINEYNKDRGSMEFHHWDDAIVCDPIIGSLGFSPDGMDIPCRGDRVAYSPNDIDQMGASKIIEVKSYGAERHFMAGMTKRMELEERWQLATAMAVAPCIEEAEIVFFNPEMTNVFDRMFVAKYDRDSLREEIETIIEIGDSWRTYLEKNYSTLAPSITPVIVSVTMEEIERDIMSSKSDQLVRLNNFSGDVVA